MSNGATEIASSRAASAPVELRPEAPPLTPVVAEPPPFEWRARLEDVARQLASLRAGLTAPARAASPLPAPFRRGVLADEVDDVRWARQDARFDRVLHVFSQEWPGIRSAAAYAPGRKLAVTAGRPLWPHERIEALRCLERVDPTAVAFHSYSPNLAALARLFRRKGAARLVGVWHGSTAQFHNDYEQSCFDAFLGLRREGLLDVLACVKPGMHLLDDRIHPDVLLNHVPRLPPPAPRSARLYGAALAPIPVDWRKNFHTNVYAAAAEPRCRTIYVTARAKRFRELPLPRNVVELQPPDRERLFQLLATMDVVLNATLSECQPMVALEALAARVPCLTGPLSMGSLDDHPYQRLVQLPGFDTLTEVRAAIGRLLDLRERSPRELDEMMADYERTLLKAADDRLGELAGS